jgi:hypothetical protein
MEPDRPPLEAWENAVALGNAWLVFAYAKNKRRFRELQRKGEHHGLQSHMERELIWRICDGDFQAFGIEHGSDAGPIPISKYYFSKTVVVDWDGETVEAFGKKFYEVRVQGEREREPAEEASPSEPEGFVIIDPREISAQRDLERLQGIPESALTASWRPNRIANQGEEEPPHESPPSEPVQSDEPLTEAAQIPAEGTRSSETRRQTSSPPRGRGRPSKEAEIEKAIDILMKRAVPLPKMPRPKAMMQIRRCAEIELNSDTNIGFSDPVLERFLLRRFGPRR